MYFAGDNFWLVMLAMVIGGCCFDSFMALKGASMTEIDGLEMGMIGSALGFAGMLETVGASITPAAGNALSTFGSERAVSALGRLGSDGDASFALLPKTQNEEKATRFSGIA